MKCMKFEYAPFGTIVAAFLAACGGSQPPIGAPAPIQQDFAITSHDQRDGSWILPEAHKGNLLYASAFDGTDTLTYPRAKFVRTLPLEYSNICSDANGNVFDLDRSAIREYRHGGSKQVAKLQDAPYSTSFDCAYDDSSGNLAVTNVLTSNAEPGDVAVFSGERGSPTFYTNPAITSYYYCTYDNQGNLFVTGRASSNFVLAELSKGSSTFTNISVDAPLPSPTEIQWDGSYLALGEYGAEKIYRLKVVGSVATVVSTVKLMGG
jgi:hypothetical protein